MSRLAFLTTTNQQQFAGTLATVNSIVEFHPEANVYIVSDREKRLSVSQLDCLRGCERVHLIDPSTLKGEEYCSDVGQLRECTPELFTGYDVIVGIDCGSILCSDVSDVVQRCAEQGVSVGGPSLYFSTVDSGKGTGYVEPLDNRLWTQHRTYWDSVIHFREGTFHNVSAFGQKQRAFHCDSPKFWLPEHREFVLSGHELQIYPYLWFLAMMWFGRCGNWEVDPYQYLTATSYHLFGDLLYFLPQIIQIYPPARDRWDDLSDSMIDRALDGIPRLLTLRGGSMSELIELVAGHPRMHRYVEIGSYQGGSILTLGLRFLNRDIDFYAVESFMGNLGGTTDGAPLPSRRTFLERLARFPGVRVRLVPGDSALAGALFDESSLDCVFIDGCHETPAVLRDIEVWLPKIRPGGMIAGDDYGWFSVRTAVHQRLQSVNVMPSGKVWWRTVSDREAPHERQR